MGDSILLIPIFGVLITERGQVYQFKYQEQQAITRYKRLKLYDAARSLATRASTIMPFPTIDRNNRVSFQTAYLCTLYRCTSSRSFCAVVVARQEQGTTKRYKDFGPFPRRHIGTSADLALHQVSQQSKKSSSTPYSALLVILPTLQEENPTSPRWPQQLFLLFSST
jgi:hypothetical protein